MLSLAVLALSPALAEEPPPPTPAPPTAAQAAEAGEELVPEPAVSPWEENAAKAIDVFPIRLLSACATIVGFGAFIVSVPLVAPAGRMTAIRESWDYFVLGPYDYTFVRPLGEL